MENLGLNEIREKYLSFFESKGHLRLPSFPLVPQNDNSLLLINAGMAPLKPYFTGKEVPPRKRVTTCQKCIRTPDIERVGKTARHGTFFEMLGNFSFGDYFKSEVIPWAWEFVTKVMEMPVDKLWVTVYEDDDEARDIWIKTGVSPDRIKKLGKEDNFWEIGTGPCGPCSEIYFDRGEKYGCGKPDCGVGCDCDRFCEFWNLVFTQFDKDENGTYNRLAHPNIDTGMGLERIAAIMQGVDNLFEVDTIRNVMKHISSIAGVEYKKDEKSDVSLRVITDHIRGTTFMICDGVIPSNEGRGYVLRRLIRRAARHGKLLGIKEPFLYKVVSTVVKESASGYPELVDKQSYIERIVKIEEERFNETVDSGLEILNDYITELKADGKNQLSGAAAFKLYDTYGFPIDLTVEILEEHGMSVDMDAYENEMNEQRERARAARGDTEGEGWKDDEIAVLIKNIDTEFVGYDVLSCNAEVKFIAYENASVEKFDKENGKFIIVTDKTPFYGESGGQVGDTGSMKSNSAEITVTDCKKQNGKFVHHCELVFGSVSVGDTLTMSVDKKRRAAISRNHSATHLLQAALKAVLGDHVAQSGSLVLPDKLRFDFSHFTAMTPDEISQTERLVNEMILDATDITVCEMPIEEARKTGAMALFGEKYGDIVRVVKIGDRSTEFCGGTHLRNTSEAALFKIVSESGIAAGIRRIEAVTGCGVLKLLNSLEEFSDSVTSALKANKDDAVMRIEQLHSEIKELKKENESLKAKLALGTLDDCLASAKDIKGVKFITNRLDGSDIGSLRNYADMIKDKVSEPFVVVLASDNDGKVNLIVTANKDAVSLGAHAGNIIKEAAKTVGGGGGGKPDSAQAGGKDASKIDDAFRCAAETLEKIIK